MRFSVLNNPPVFALAIFGALVSLPTVCAAAKPQPPIVPKELTCEYMDSPVGLDTTHPRLSWKLASELHDELQTGYEIRVASSPNLLQHGDADIWDSGHVHSKNTVAVPYAGRPLRSGEKCYWSVTVSDNHGHRATSEQNGFWQMGLLAPSDWKARWIMSPYPRPGVVDNELLPAPTYFRRTIDLTKPVKSATIYATARGVYEMYCNGGNVSDALLSPGWTDYNKHIQYQSYDVTEQIRPGRNVIGAILADGWYSGYVGFGHRRDHYGQFPSLYAQLNIVFTDGTKAVYATDTSWRANHGPILYSDLLQGESYDARLANKAWDTASVSDSHWTHALLFTPGASQGIADVTTKVRALLAGGTYAIVANNDNFGDPAYNSVKKLTIKYTVDGISHIENAPEQGSILIPAAGKVVIVKATYGPAAAPTLSKPAEIVANIGPPVRVTQNMPARSVKKAPSGKYIFDIGQNMVGWARLQIHAPAGTKIVLRFGEMLDSHGELYTANLRSAGATDTYICSGKGLETFEPHFTFHGFRYVEMTGYPGVPKLSAIVGRVIGSDNPVIGSFECSSHLVNQLQHNILWGQRGNFLSVPTDCPQRDERLGWMGDAQIFVRTASWNAATTSFYEKWLRDVQDGQSAEGGYSDVSPRVVDDSDGAPAWGDAGIIVPWTVYMMADDTQVLAKHWVSMVGWMNYITSVNPDGLWMNRRNNDFGDWLSIAADTPKDVLATAYYAYDASLMEQMANALGKKQEAAEYARLFQHIKSAFNAAYVSPDGSIKGNTQTDYVVALRFNLLPENLRPMAAHHLADAIVAKNDHLSTGFIGVGYLCPTLSDNGLNDFAYKLLQQTTFPSWGYSIKQGATTIWERWDGYRADKGFQDPGMNSFNHYSLGSIGEWLYRYVAGIDMRPGDVGFAHTVIHPRPGPGLTYAHGVYDSIRGIVRSSWKQVKGGMQYDFEVPANTTSTLVLESGALGTVTDGTAIVHTGNGVHSIGRDGKNLVLEVGSGTYHFLVSNPGR